MESTLEIRKRIHEFIDIADKRILRIINGIIDAEEQEDNYPTIPDWHYDKLNERREKYITGESKSYTWEEVKEKAKSALK
ncbi:addiction module protein [Chryseobacterium scophthalmum]|uniref:addiction module protein n=1 Tax=Chryseobacterium TaxID=59732 RepID=UPI001E3F8269|nr:addiction module protein [Chryseobacterium sp. LC2016-27]MCD0454689.1 addiction module protein [Chryseobacterium sp. LC2016-27]